MKRAAKTSRIVKAGCCVCHGTAVHWAGANAQAVAARHHDATGHETWAEMHLIARYGQDAPDARQIDIEDAIAAQTDCSPPPLAAL